MACSHCAASAPHPPRFLARFDVFQYSKLHRFHLGSPCVASSTSPSSFPALSLFRQLLEYRFDSIERRDSSNSTRSNAKIQRIEFRFRCFSRFREQTSGFQPERRSIDQVMQKFEHLITFRFFSPCLDSTQFASNSPKNESNHSLIGQWLKSSETRIGAKHVLRACARRSRARRGFVVRRPLPNCSLSLSLSSSPSRSWLP